ncbi:MAG TPA: RIP metalloprotease RseP [Chromatiales bacterium]|nr:RIP metalloprotease RseP [Thiotrichales bacterium]HIP67126.1 RIP metalloprotease RseP [Chromatiales bacterium]
MGIVINILAFIAAIAILVAIHEFGHFWVAKKMGVKVLRYSIGFGRPLWKRQASPDDTEYVVAAIPLGGYVKMLDEREGEVAKHELDQAFNRKPVSKRFAIVAAGPIFNFLFAIAAYALMYMVGVSGMKPVIGTVEPGSMAAEAGLMSDMQIEQVNGEVVESWEEAALTLIDQALDSGQVTLQVRSDRGQSTHQLDLSDTRQLLGSGESDFLQVMGIIPWRPELPAKFGKIIRNDPAEQAGLKPGDEILEANGQTFTDWNAWVEFVRARPDETLDLTILRDGKKLTLKLHTVRHEAEGKVIGRIGAAPYVDREMYKDMAVNVRYGPIKSFTRGVKQTWKMSVLIVRVLWKMITGEASVKNISGPITIAEFAGVSAMVGVSAFLGFLALISVSLGVMNLLPVPVLDGGHLFFYLIEMVKGSPVSETTEAIGQRIGLALLGGLMFLAFYNDITRLMN